MVGAPQRAQHMARSHHRISGRTTWPSLLPIYVPTYLPPPLCLSPVSAQGRNASRWTNQRSDKKTTGESTGVAAAPPSARSFHSLTSRGKTYQSHSRINSWIFSIARNYARLAIFRKQLNPLFCPRVNFYFQKLMKWCNKGSTLYNLYLYSNIKRRLKSIWKRFLFCFKK